MKKIIIILIVFSVFGILSCASIYKASNAEVSQSNHIGKRDNTEVPPGRLFSGETKELLNELLSKFDEEKFSELTIEKNGMEFIAIWTTFVSRDHNVLLEKSVINGNIEYDFIVLHPEGIGYYHAIIFPANRKFRLGFNDKINFTLIKDHTIWNKILNGMIKTFNEANIELDNELSRPYFKMILEELAKKESTPSFLEGSINI